MHFRGAGDVGKAAHYALAAAEQAAAALAFERAARLYRLALDLQPGEPSERHRLWVKLGDALANGGRVIEAAQAYLTAAQGADATERRELQRQAAEQFLMGGYLDQGLTLLRSVLTAAGLSLPATSRRALLWILLRRPYMLLRGTRFRERTEREIPADELWRVDLCHSAVRSLGFTETMFAIEFQMRHLLLALKVGEPYRVTRALGFEAIADGRDRGSRPRAERLLKTVTGLLDRVPAPYKPDATANIHVTAGMLAFLAGHWKTASIELQQAEHMFREQSTLPYKLVVVQVYTLTALYQSGQLPEYFRRIPECLKESLDRGNAFAEANLRLQNAQRRCFLDDQPEGALEELREANARWAPRGFLQIHASELFHRGDFALYCGDARDAWDILTEGWPRLSRSSHLGRAGGGAPGGGGLGGWGSGGGGCRGPFLTIPFPEWVEPMAATLTQERFTGPEWIFERKLDGIRLLAFKQGPDVRLLSRNRLPQNIPAVAEAIANLPVHDVILDGEVTWGPGHGRLPRVRHPVARWPRRDVAAARRSAARC